MIIDRPSGRIISRANPAPRPGDRHRRDEVTLHFDRAENLYDHWSHPTCIIADGPYGVGGFPGDPPTPATLAEWYAPHIAAWSRRATPQTTLWFWNTELGWATVHPVLVANGWEYRSCHVWDKGKGHVAGNANSLTLRKFPVVTEVCVQYVKRAFFRVDGQELTMQDWLRHEWKRTGLPFYLANKATGTANAATRKYLTACHLWYYPPVEAFEGLAAYANRHGRPEGRPYFSVDGKRSLTGREWASLRAKFSCEVGISNVWSLPPVRGSERLKKKFQCVHNNQKPLQLIDICIKASTDPGDLVWEPFGGLCSAAISSHRLGRGCVSAEILPEYYAAARERLRTYDAE
ncbi:MAG TPA: DNA methyltransferase [Gemmatimonadales bacterium]|jgi:site-specific DNA-methyltransferase (adenine-specific)|nr:DNA methyltransferase [Gemmatimonadales bacterium]